jgi:cation/acetate symporter
MADYMVRLRRYYVSYTVGFFAFVLMLAVLERYGMPPRWIGYSFSAVDDLPVCDDRRPGSDHQRCRILRCRPTRAGRVQRHGHRRRLDELRLVHGAGGNPVPVGPSGVGLRHGVDRRLRPRGVAAGTLSAPLWPIHDPGLSCCPLWRQSGTCWSGVLATILASFVYVVAQIYAVGLITSRFVGLQFEIGVFVGLAGILVCSFLGGMRAVTWTQVAQYAILIVAYLVPVTILSHQVTGVPLGAADLWRRAAAGATVLEEKNLRRSGRSRGAPPVP